MSLGVRKMEIRKSEDEAADETWEPGVNQPTTEMKRGYATSHEGKDNDGVEGLNQGEHLLQEGAQKAVE